MTIHHRRMGGPEDVTVGEHPDLGLCVFSHYGLEDRIEWFTQRPVRATEPTVVIDDDLLELVDGLINDP